MSPIDPNKPIWSYFLTTRPVLSERFSTLIKAARETEDENEEGDQSAIINALEFTRWLGIYYNLAILALLLIIFIGRKTDERIRKWNKKRRKVIKTESEIIVVESSSTSNTSSSSSSASEVRLDVVDEARPLLSTSSEKVPRVSRRAFLTRRVSGLLGHQRENDFRGRVRPTNGVAIAQALFTLLHVFLSFYWIYLPVDTTNNTHLKLFLVADRLGLLFTMNLPLLYLFAAKTSPIKYLTGWSYEQLNVFHRSISNLCIYLSVLHFAGMYVVYRVFLAGRGFTFIQILLRPDILLGTIAFFFFYLFAQLSTDEFRAYAYEVFLACHIAFSVLAMGFLFHHHPTARIYVALSLLIWLIDRLVYRLWRNRWAADGLVEVLDESTVKVTMKHIGGKKGAARGGSGAGITGRWEWEPAAHVFLTVPGWNRYQAHPFTVMTPPAGFDLPTTANSTTTSGNDGEEEKEKDMVLIIRKQAGFSAALFDMGRETGGRIPVIIDGPYGSSHAREVLRECRKCVLVAGGSGVCVAWPLMVEVLRRKVDKAVATISASSSYSYGINGGDVTSPISVSSSSSSSSAPTSPLGGALARRGRSAAGRKGTKIVLLWIVQYEHHLRWMDKDLEELEEVKRRLPRGVRLEVEVRKFVTKGPNGGRPDLRQEISGVVDDEDGIRREGRTAVIVCGPDGMVRDVRTVGRDLLWAGKDVEVVAEKFGW